MFLFIYIYKHISSLLMAIILCLEGHDNHSAIFCECSCMHLFLIFGFFTFLCLNSLGIISFIQKKKVKLEISIFPIAGIVENVYNGRFCGMLGTAACWMIMVFVGGGDQKRSLVGCLEVPGCWDNKSKMKRLVCLTGYSSLTTRAFSEGETETCLSTQLPNLPP